MLNSSDVVSVTKVLKSWREMPLTSKQLPNEQVSSQAKLPYYKRELFGCAFQSGPVLQNPKKPMGAKSSIQIRSLERGGEERALRQVRTHSVGASGDVSGLEQHFVRTRTEILQTRLACAEATHQSFVFLTCALRAPATNPLRDGGRHVLCMQDTIGSSLLQEECQSLACPGSSRARST
jgi:hypothetical protein